MIKEVRAVSPVMEPKRRAILLGELASSRQEVKSNVQTFQRLCRQFRTKGAAQGNSVTGESITEQDTFSLD